MALQNSFNNRLVAGLVVALGSDAAGDIYYRNASGLLTRLAIGSNGQVLAISGGLPVWQSGVSPVGAAGGDLTGNYPNPSIANNAVSYSKIQNVSASQRLLGRNAAGAGPLEELDPATVRTLLALGTAALANTGIGAGQIPVLDAGGKIPNSVIPSIALTSLQVVADQAARLALSNVDVGDLAKQADNGLTYLLTATPASTDANWVPIGDTTITASDIVSGTVATARLGSGTASANSFLRGDQSWQPLPYTALPLSDVTGTAQTMGANNRYLANNAALCTLTLPTSAPQGSILQIWGVGAGGWRIAQNTSQQMHFGNLSTTAGTSGRFDSTHRRDCVQLECVVANTEWQVVQSIGTIDVI